MLDRIRSIAWRLEQEGIGCGDRVALMGENHPHWAMIYLGILYRGAVVVPLDPAGSGRDAGESLSRTRRRGWRLSIEGRSSDSGRSRRDVGREVPVVTFGAGGEGRRVASRRYGDWAKTVRPAGFDERDSSGDDTAIRRS
jgi:hypothetical protein